MPPPRSFIQLDEDCEIAAVIRLLLSLSFPDSLPTTTSMQIQSILPRELWTECIDYLDDDKTSLLSCSLVSRAWCTRARCHLFAYIELCVVRSLDRTKRFFRLLRSPHCTIARAVRSLLLQDFDDPFLFTSLKNPERFMRRLLRDFTLFPSLQGLEMRHSLWNTCMVGVGSLPTSPSLRVFKASHMAIIRLGEISLYLSQLFQLEELVYFLEVLDTVEDEPLESLHPLLQGLRRITFHTRITARASSKGQCRLYDWLEASRPPHLEYLWINPLMGSMRGVGNMLIAVRPSLREIYFRPAFNWQPSDAKATVEDVNGVFPTFVLVYGSSTLRLTRLFLFAEALRDLPECRLSLLTKFTLCKPSPTWTWTPCASSEKQSHLLLELVLRILGPAEESKLQHFEHLCISEDRSFRTTSLRNHPTVTVVDLLSAEVHIGSTRLSRIYGRSCFVSWTLPSHLKF